MPLNHFSHGHGRPLLILHGLFGAAKNWTSIAKRLSASHHVFALDMRNHGDNQHVDDMDYDEMADDVKAFIEGHHLQNPLILGHSMGGKTAMTLALHYPHLVGGLIVVDIAPVPYDHNFDDYITAMEGLDLSVIERRSQADDTLKEGIKEDMMRAFLIQNLAIDENGARWRVNLEAIREALPDILSFPTTTAHRTYMGDTLFIAGGKSDYVRAEHHAKIKHFFPKAEIDIIPEAGHWTHADQPGPFIKKVQAFLARHG